MKCENCGTDTQCHTIPIYYAQVFGRESATRNELLKSTTTNVTRYGEIKKREYQICIDCAFASKKRSLNLRPLYSFIVIAAIVAAVKVIELMSFISRGVFNIILYIACGLFVVLTASSIIGLARKSYKKVTKGSLYLAAMKFFKKELKSKSKKTEYQFWNEYPNHLKVQKR